MKNYHWEVDPVPGYYNFCYDDDGNYNYYIQEVSVCFRDWPKERYDRTFNGVKFVWNCVGSHYNPLKADNINDAMDELEDIYEKKLDDIIKSLNEEKTRAIDNMGLFLLYKNKKKRRMITHGKK